MADRVDTLGMWEATLALPDLMAESMGAIGTVGGLPDLSQLEHVIILGMGGSGFGGDVAAASARPFSSLPIVVYNGYLPPSWVGSTTLVIAISASGATEETLEALEAAIEAGASLVAVTAGGELATLARRAGAPVLPVVGDAPMPRAGLGALAVPAMLVLEQLGLFPGASVWIEEAIEHLRVRRDAFQGSTSPARVVADRIERTMPVVYGGGAIGTAAAKRWKVAVNHNAKQPSFWAPMPELCHTELVGWTDGGDRTRDIFTQVHLRHSYEHPQTARRFDFVGDTTRAAMRDVVSVVAEGEGPVAQLLDLVLLGDMTSLELAAAAGTDPGPLPVVERLKEWLEG